MAAVPNSILDTTKKVLGVAPENTVFDIDILMYINSVFADLVLIGVGPDEGYAIEDSTTLWTDYLEGKLYLNQVQAYMYLRVRLLFDPPATSYATEALRKQADKYEWMLSLYSKDSEAEEPSGPKTAIESNDGVYNLTGGLDFPSYAPVGVIGIDADTGITYKKA